MSSSKPPSTHGSCHRQGLQCNIEEELIQPWTHVTHHKVSQMQTNTSCTVLCRKIIRLSSQHTHRGYQTTNPFTDRGKESKTLAAKTYYYVFENILSNTMCVCVAVFIFCNPKLTNEQLLSSQSSSPKQKGNTWFIKLLIFWGYF